MLIYSTIFTLFLFFFAAVKEAVVLKTLSYQEAWEMVGFLLGRDVLNRIRSLNCPMLEF